MELEGRSYLQHEAVGEKSVNWYIGTLIRDHHRAIGKWIRTALPTAKHVYDVWHIAKGMYTDKHKRRYIDICTKRKLVALSKGRDCGLPLLLICNCYSC